MRGSQIDINAMANAGDEARCQRGQAAAYLLHHHLDHIALLNPFRVGSLMILQHATLEHQFDGLCVDPCAVCVCLQEAVARLQQARVGVVQVSVKLGLFKLVITASTSHPQDLFELGAALQLEDGFRAVDILELRGERAR